MEAQPDFIGTLVNGFPSFLGLIVAIYILERENRLLREEIRHLLGVIIKGENCPEEGNV